MPDAIFAEPRLARLYDHFDDDRSDLAAYRALVTELGARSVLDVGCGTGSLLVLLATDPRTAGLELVGLDPAGASLAVARTKPGAERVRWIEGTAPVLAEADPPVRTDLAVMTGNVAQVFLTDEEWRATLAAVRSVLPIGGHLVFESRRPERRAWEDWAAPGVHDTERDVPGEGRVRSTFALTEVAPPYVGFRSHYVFADGTEADSTSRLRFRTVEETTADLVATGFDLVEIREAPDRPGLENVYVCRAATAP